MTPTITPIGLLAFLETEEGSNMWDSPEVRLICYNITVFVLEGNDEIKLDKLGLIDKETNGFTDKVANLLVTGLATADEVNYIFVEEVVAKSYKIQTCGSTNDEYFIEDQDGNQLTGCMSYEDTQLIIEDWTKEAK